MNSKFCAIALALSAAVAVSAQTSPAAMMTQDSDYFAQILRRAQP